MSDGMEPAWESIMSWKSTVGVPFPATLSGTTEISTAPTAAVLSLSGAVRSFAPANTDTDKTPIKTAAGTPIAR
jgi:hypothetical protein